MSLSLGNPPPAYDQHNQSVTQAAIEAADAQNVKMGQIFDKLMIRDTVTGVVKTVTIASGAWVIT